MNPSFVIRDGKRVYFTSKAQADRREAFMEAIVQLQLERRTDKLHELGLWPRKEKIPPEMPLPEARERAERAVARRKRAKKKRGG